MLPPSNTISQTDSLSHREKQNHTLPDNQDVQNLDLLAIALFVYVLAQKNNHN